MFSELAEWRKTRFKALPFLPLAAALLALAWPAGRGGLALTALGLLGLILLLQLRLVDELADREHDRERHPERVLVRASSLLPFQLAAAALALCGLGGCLLLLPPRATLTAAALLALMPLFYGLSRLLQLPRLLHAQMVLLKYPVLVFVLADAPWPPEVNLLRRLATTFLLIGIYELVDDGELRARRGGSTLLAIYTFLLATLWIWPLWRPLEAPL